MGQVATVARSIAENLQLIEAAVAQLVGCFTGQMLQLMQQIHERQRVGSVDLVE